MSAGNVALMRAARRHPGPAGWRAGRGMWRCRSPQRQREKERERERETERDRERERKSRVASLFPSMTHALDHSPVPQAVLSGSSAVSVSPSLSLTESSALETERTARSALRQ